MTQQVEVPATKPASLSLISEPQMVEGENQLLPKCPATSPRALSSPVLSDPQKVCFSKIFSCTSICWRLRPSPHFDDCNSRSQDQAHRHPFQNTTP